MIRITSLLATVLIAASVAAEPIALDFADPAALEAVTRHGRQSYVQDEAHVVLRGGSAMYVTQATGPGVYHVRFRMVEPENYQYHVPSFEFFKADADDPESDGYSIMWRGHGIITLSAVSGGERVHRREFIDPGRGNPNRYESGDVVDLTIRIPPEGDCVELYAHRSEPEGEPTCRFKLLEDLPLEGHFGWRNTKWNSHAWIHQLNHQPGG